MSEDKGKQGRREDGPDSQNATLPGQTSKPTAGHEGGKGSGPGAEPVSVAQVQSS